MVLPVRRTWSSVAEANFAASLDLSTLDGSEGFRIDGVVAGDKSGIAVSNAGDVNGDGYADMLIGASLADPGGSQSGQSYVVFGGGDGFAANLELSGLDGSNGFRLDGIDVDDQSGLSVSTAGDVNGDGYADILVGAPKADPGGDSNAGETYLVFGKANGFAASLDLGALDGNNGYRLDGIDADDDSGFSVSTAGDVNGDGFDDILVGAHWASQGDETLRRRGIRDLWTGQWVLAQFGSQCTGRQQRLPPGRNRCGR